jgi:hypothetical protein
MLVADDDDAVANLAERRFFATLTAAKSMQDECEILREVRDLAEEAWRRARARLADLETLRDALGGQLAERDRKQSQAQQPPNDRVLSAA